MDSTPVSTGDNTSSTVQSQHTSLPESEYHKTEVLFSYELMSVLTGTKPVPDSQKEISIKDRSISPMENQRQESIEYIQREIQKLEFTCEIQEWDGAYVINRGVFKDAQFKWKYRNVVITIPGTLPPEQQNLIILGAHHDTQNSMSHCWHGTQETDYIATVGADDNTSGVVGCLTLLYRLKKKSIKLNNTLKIVLFDGEEPGIANAMCTGSSYFVNKLSDKETENTNIAVIMDMIGAPPTVPGIGIVISVGDTVSVFDLIETVSDIPGEIPVTLAHTTMNNDLSCLSLSDSVRFEYVSIPTLLMCNVAGYSTVPSFYHTEKDTMEILNWPTFFRSLDLAEGIILKADKHSFRE